MAFWFNTSTGEVAESDSPMFDASVRMGPYKTRVEAEHAFAISAARNIVADAADRGREDSYDAAEREWKENW
ncbi:hypothetical protein INS90_04310 [Trueperella pecoris]|uniref:Methionine aminopeptidase n=1 Tax=Trueperella pecoris TaxID=2733571 RepID=A0A7M1R2H2_9ACTO|nr:hypothetical protein [Trueperella pecoris]QOR48490.1 hypothetical protein INS90_04310 [Trueperella pecoris]